MPGFSGFGLGAAPNPAATTVRGPALATGAQVRAKKGLQRGKRARAAHVSRKQADAAACAEQAAGRQAAGSSTWREGPARRKMPPRGPCTRPAGEETSPAGPVTRQQASVPHDRPARVQVRVCMKARPHAAALKACPVSRKSDLAFLSRSLIQRPPPAPSSSPPCSVAWGRPPKLFPLFRQEQICFSCLRKHVV